MRKTYTFLGEKGFLAKYRAEFIQEFKNDPFIFLKKAGHRLVRAFLVPVSMYPGQEGHGSSVDLKFILKATVYWVPLFMCIYFLFAKNIPDINTLRAGATIFFVYLAPYVLVGFYRRYRIPLVPVFVIFYFYFAMHIIDVLQCRRISAYREK